MQRDIVDVLRKQIEHVASDRLEALIKARLEPNPHKSSDPAEVIIRDSGTPVWAIVGYLPAVNGDLEEVAKDYGVDLEAILAAVAYYLNHQQLIDWRLVQNRGEPVTLL